MNRKERKARGIKGKKGDQAVIQNALLVAKELDERGLHEEAFKLKMQVLEFDPENIPVLLDLSMYYVHNEMLGEAEKVYNKVLRLDPRNGNALTLLAKLRMEQYRTAEALQAAEKAVRLGPSPTGWTLLGDIYREDGQMEKGRECLEKALELQPDFVPALYSLGLMHKATPETVVALEKMVSSPKLQLPQKIKLEFTLGRACMETGQTDEAFRHFYEANLLKRATYRYDISEYEQYTDYIIELFDEAVVKRLRGKGSVKSNRPIFIVGMPRSGSTLVDQILSSHPDVNSVGESRYWGDSVPLYRNERVPNYFKTGAINFTQKMIDDLSPQMLDAIGRKYLELTEPAGKGAARVVDKMLFNYIFTGLIRLALPEAKIIHCTRDPVDIALSIWQINFSAGIPWAYDQQDLGRYYLGYKKLMAHWNKLFPGEIYEANYETIVADQEGETRRLLEFCGLPWDERTLRFYETSRQVKTASSTQVRQPIYKDSVKKWKKYEKHLEILIKTLEAGKAL